MNKLIKQAFTLIELLVVIAIIGILSGLIIVSMGGMTTKASIAKLQIFSNSLKNSLLINLVSEWKFDGSGLNDGDNISTIYTQDGWSNKNNCSIVGAPRVKNGANCIDGSCVQFNGTADYLDCGNSSSLNITDAITISAWIYRGDWSTGNTYKAIVSKYWSAFEMYVVNGLISFQANRSGSLVGSSNFIISSGWHHVVFRFDKNNLSSLGQYHALFLDGQIVPLLWRAGADTNTPLGSNSFSVAIGGRPGPAILADCVIDEVRIYNAAASVSQIKEQYYSGLNSLFINGGISVKDYLSRLNNYASVY